MLSIGLNPYGLAYALGIHAAGTPRTNPAPMTLDEYVTLARDLGCKGIELHAEHLFPLTDARLRQFAEQFEAAGWWVVLARPLMIDHWPRTIEVARLLHARLIRMHCTPVLCGDRRTSGCDWPQLVNEVKHRLCAASQLTRDHGLQLAIENHQDFCSSELVELCATCGDNIGITLDTANPLSVAEDPIDAAHAMAPEIRHLHLKDYRAQWTEEGYRLIRCPTGDGCIPFNEIAAIFADRSDITASIEIGALTARHIRFLQPDYWTHHPPRRPEQLDKARQTARINAYREGEEWRTPWELELPPDEIVAYELAQVRRSADNLRQMGLM